MIERFNQFNEEKSEKWIKDAIKKPGSLRKSMKKKKGEKITNTEIDSELQALRGKDKNKSKKGIQGLSKRDLTKYRKLNLAKTLKGLKEHQETDNYMFFGNLQTIKRLVDEMLEMDPSQVDSMLSSGHNWAVDHIATSKDDIEEVFNFLAGHERTEDTYDIEIKPENIVTDENRKKEIEDKIWKGTIFDKSRVQNFDNFEE